MKMKSAFFLLFAVLVCCFLWLQRNNFVSPIANSVGGAVVVNRAERVASKPEQAEPPVRAGGVVNSASELLGFECRSEPECESNVLGASSPKEARWLIARGYPSPTRLVELEGMSIDQLQRLAKQGD